MSRVHDALRKAERMGTSSPEGADPAPGETVSDSRPLALPEENGIDIPAARLPAFPDAPSRGEPRELKVDWGAFLSRCRTIPFRPAAEAHLIDIQRPHEAPGEEFRTLRTRLNHMQSQQDLHAIVVASASPAEGKAFTAVNLALAQAHLETPVLLADLDLRRPVVHTQFQCDKGPGFSDF